MSDANLDINLGQGGETARPLDDTPFRIAVLGDFSGRATRGATESGAALTRRPAWRVDRDDLDEVMKEMGAAVSLRLEAGGPALGIRFHSLDDFHPDRLFDRLPVFQALRDLRQRLSNPTTFKAAAAEMIGGPPPASRPASGASVLGDILDAASPVNIEETMAEAGGDLHGFIQRVLKPHLVPNADPRQAELVSQVEAAASATLRAILHAPGYQSLEGLWRAVDLLVRQVETSAELKILLIDLSQAELANALPAGGDPAVSPLARLLAAHADPEPWSLLIGAYEFGDSPEEVDRLAQLAALGGALRAPWISAAQPGLAAMGQDVGEISTWPQPNQGWQTLRSATLSKALGMVLPRFLARLPYGKGLEECERFRFEELTPEAPPEQFLWGNPAVTVAVVLGRAFAEHGWSLMRGLEPEISGLPVGTLGRGPAARAIGPGEGPLSVRAADVLMSRGFMVLAPLKESDRVRLVRVQSAADPIAGLSGRWVH